MIVKFFEWVGRGVNRLDEKISSRSKRPADSPQPSPSPSFPHQENKGLHKDPDKPLRLFLDCSACRTEKSMEPVKIPRFNQILRFIGTIIVVPSIIGVLISLIWLISVTFAGSRAIDTAVSHPETTGAVIGMGIGYGISIFFGILSLVSGLIGWILLMKRKVYKCLVCGFILDRD